MVARNKLRILNLRPMRFAAAYEEVDEAVEVWEFRLPQGVDELFGASHRCGKLSFQEEPEAYIDKRLASSSLCSRHTSCGRASEHKRL